MQCPRCQQDNPSHAKFCLECGTRLTSAKPGGPHLPSYAEVTRALSEAVDQQTATSDILSVISRSPTDVQPVLQTIAETSARVCSASDGVAFLTVGVRLRIMAHHGAIGALIGQERDLDRTSVSGRAAVDRRPVHVADLQAEEREFPIGSQVARQFGHRTTLAVPLLRDGKALGALLIRRLEVRPFSDKQIALLQTFADQAVIAIENVRLFKELESRNRDLTTALDQQTATSEILRIISASPTDVQPVFDEIARSAAQLCQAAGCVVTRFDGEQLHVAAAHTPVAEFVQFFRTRFPIAPDRSTGAGRAVLDGTVVHIANTVEDPEYGDPEVRRQAQPRSVLATPLLREGRPIGAIVMGGREAGRFSDKQVALLQTFADQAVIAIENARLFAELQTSNRELTTALDTQTATSDILRVISRSQTDVQPVFDAILSSAVRLLGANTGALTRIIDDRIELAALTRTDDAADAAIRAAFPQPLQSEGVSAQAIRDRAPLNISDAHTDPRFPEAEHARARARGYRSRIVVPMLGRDQAIGAIGVTRREPGGFTDDEVALLQTFADEAVIAIENVRLFTETKETLEQQTATGDILKVIASSPTDVQPVLDAVAESAARLCGAVDAIIQRVDGDTMRRVAHFGGITSVSDARAVTPDTPSGRAILERQTTHIDDILDAFARGEYLETRALQQGSGFRTVLAVPLMREHAVIGVITIRRLEVRPFTTNQMALLKTFADQAVIAIENVRLFKELEARNRELTKALDRQTATADVLRIIAQSPTELQPVLDAIAASAVRLCAASDAVIERLEGDRFYNAAHAGTRMKGLVGLPLPLTRGFPGGRAILDRKPVIVDDFDLVASEYPDGLALSKLNEIHSLAEIPLLSEGKPLGSLAILRAEVRPFTDAEIALLKTFADQAVIAIENVRLFRELEVANRELSAASQHKSEFLANMSHELRTPLNAIIGFSEVLSEKMFGELNEKQEEYLKDIYASGTHLLSLINDILDLSKIEAGRMELELTDFHLPTALDNALTLVRERAGRRNITLQMSIDERLGEIQADERKIRQVVLNLLSNAIKFTPEGGRIEVGALPKDGFVDVSVSDTGVGIAPEDQDAVFEEFRQVGTAEKKAEGTGLGLTLCRKFIELHGGRIWVTSQVGVGSTFTFTIPVRRGE
jgi:GAF domain-containing protein